MTKTNLAAFVLLAIGVWAQFGRSTHEAIPSIARPTAELVAAVTPIQKALAGQRTDGIRIAAFYVSLADVIARDNGSVVRTAADLRDVNRRAGLLMFQQTGTKGKYPALAPAIEKLLADHVGLENTPMDDARRAKAVEAFKAIAWACGGGNA